MTDEQFRRDMLCIAKQCADGGTMWHRRFTGLAWFALIGAAGTIAAVWHCSDSIPTVIFQSVCATSLLKTAYYSNREAVKSLKNGLEQRQVTLENMNALL